MVFKLTQLQLHCDTCDVWIDGPSHEIKAQKKPEFLYCMRHSMM